MSRRATLMVCHYLTPARLGHEHGSASINSVSTWQRLGDRGVSCVHQPRCACRPSDRVKTPIFTFTESVSLKNGRDLSGSKARRASAFIGGHIFISRFV